MRSYEEELHSESYQFWCAAASFYLSFLAQLLAQQKENKCQNAQVHGSLPWRRPVRRPLIIPTLEVDNVNRSVTRYSFNDLQWGRGCSHLDRYILSIFFFVFTWCRLFVRSLNKSSPGSRRVHHVYDKREKLPAQYLLYVQPRHSPSRKTCSSLKLLN